MRADFKASTFTLENGAQTIEVMFPQVEKHLYEDALIVTEAEPLAAYILSMAPQDLRTDTQRATLRQIIAEEMAKTGAILITKDTGLFIARKA